MEVLHFGAIFEDYFACAPFVFLSRIATLLSACRSNCALPVSKTDTFSVQGESQRGKRG